MARIKTKWLVVWFDPNGKVRDGIERLLPGCPRVWAQKRCGAGETFDIWNITDEAVERRVRAALEERGK